LKKNRDKKIMVFMSSCAAVKYTHELLNYIDLPVTCIHVRVHIRPRTRTIVIAGQTETAEANYYFLHILTGASADTVVHGRRRTRS
jgi:hypothetical protein